MMAVYLEGLGLLAPGLPGWRQSLETLAGAAPYRETALPALAPGLLPANERRRTTRVIRLALQVAAEAVAESGRNPREVCSVFASSSGDCEVLDRICRALALPDRPVSPTQFHNSVHNAAGGYWAIATGCRQPSVSLSAHRHSFAAGLLEAVTQVIVEGVPCLLVAYDDPPPFPLSETCRFGAPFATALLLAPARTPRSQARLALELVCEGEDDRIEDEGLEALRAANPAARGLPLLRTVAAGVARRVVLPYSCGRHLAVWCDVPGGA